MNNGSNVPGVVAGEDPVNSGGNSLLYLIWVCKTLRRFLENVRIDELFSYPIEILE